MWKQFHSNLKHIIRLQWSLSSFILLNAIPLIVIIVACNAMVYDCLVWPACLMPRSSLPCWVGEGYQNWEQLPVSKFCNGFARAVYLPQFVSRIRPKFEGYQPFDRISFVATSFIAMAITLKENIEISYQECGGFACNQ